MNWLEIYTMAIIATEKDVIDAGGVGIWASNKCCTRAKAETFGMEMKSAYTSYADHQLIPEGSYQKESVTPTLFSYDIRWNIRGSLRTSGTSQTLHISLGGISTGTGPSWTNGDDISQTMPSRSAEGVYITTLEIEADGGTQLASSRIIVSGSGTCTQAVPNFVRKITLTLDEPIRPSNAATYTFNIQLNG